MDAAVKTRADRLPAPARLRISAGPTAPAGELQSFALLLPATLRLDPRGIRRCPLTVEELVAADPRRCRRSRVGSGTVTRIAADGTPSTFRLRFLRGGGDEISVRYSGASSGALVTDIADDGYRFELPVEWITGPGFRFGGLTLSLGRTSGRSIVRMEGCGGGRATIGFTFRYPSVPLPDGTGEAAAQESYQRPVTCVRPAG